MIRYILKSINTLNLLLTAVLLLMAGYVLLPLTRAGTFSAPQVKPAAKQQAAVPQVTEEQSSAAADYIVISDRNLFHPERIIPVEKKEEKPLPKPDFVLYGTLIDGETKLAFMDDLKAPYTTPGRGKRQRSIAQGGNLSGFVLSEVHEDRVVMVRGEEKIPVILDDKLHKRKEPAVTTTAPAPAAAEKQQPAPAAQARRPAAAASGAPAAQMPIRNPRAIQR
jgi:hypothetical protein